jgi:hypothetical protein
MYILYIYIYIYIYKDKRRLLYYFSGIRPLRRLLLLMFYQEKPQSCPYWARGQLQQQDRQARHNGRWRPGHPKGPCPRLGAKDVSMQGAVASVRVLRTRRAAGAGTPGAEALSARAVLPCRRVSSHYTRQCGATATWRLVSW